MDKITCRNCSFAEINTQRWNSDRYLRCKYLKRGIHTDPKYGIDDLIGPICRYYASRIRSNHAGTHQERA